MKLNAILLASVAALAIVGGGVEYFAIAADKVPAVVADSSLRPAFPVEGEKSVAQVETVPAGAQYRVRSGKSGVRYVACNGQRTYASGAVELHCLIYSKSKGWGKSLRWIPKYQLAPLTGPMPAEPVTTASR